LRTRNPHPGAHRTCETEPPRGTSSAFHQRSKPATTCCTCQRTKELSSPERDARVGRGGLAVGGRLAVLQDVGDEEAGGRVPVPVGDLERARRRRGGAGDGHAAVVGDAERLVAPHGGPAPRRVILRQLYLQRRKPAAQMCETLNCHE
jgi:hypothetical protein